jgi:hypothetical protein
MTTGIQNPQAAVEAAAKLVQILAPLSSEERKMAIDATMIFLRSTAGGEVAPTKRSESHYESGNSDGISAKGLAWMKKCGISRQQLDHVFSIDGGSVEVIASRMPGSSRRQQTVEAYVIAGLKGLLHTGEPNFSDKEARGVCSKVGCYDIGNHSNYINALGNLVSGSRDTGWKLSNPGLERAAEIVRILAPTPNPNP